MPFGRVLVGIVLSLTALPFSTRGEGPNRFIVPATKEGWPARRAELASALEAALGQDRPRLPESITADPDGIEEHDGLRVERFHFQGGSGKPVRGVFVRKVESGSSRLPALLYLADGENAGLRPGLDGLPPALEIARRGMAVLSIEVETALDPRERFARWPEIVRDDQYAYELLIRRPDVDPAKVGVLGVGLGGTRAVWLMALREKVGFGVAIGGLTRFADWLAANPTIIALPSWIVRVMDGLDTESLVALTAGRTLEWTVGDRDASSPVAGVQVVENVGRAMDRLVGNGRGFHVTRLGRQDERYGRLQWIGALEIFDKAFFPQVATPLGHAIEPEPQVTGDFVDLASHGLAGWAVEMSQRPTTWTWTDGVIACKPGPNEYGWLRAPIEVDDFILTVEWRDPPGGNSGVFLRARPVPWTFPPSAANKRIVGTLALDWPSRTGLELQAAADPGEANKYSSGSLYRHTAPAENPTNPPNHWNRYTVRARGTRVEVWSNGAQVLDARIDEYPLTLPNPPMRGYIGLQNHGAPAEFRNVKLLRLNK